MIPRGEPVLQPNHTQLRRILFVGRWNATRSIMAEAIANRFGTTEFRAHSAGMSPGGAVDPLAESLLRRRGYETEGLFSKHWQEFHPATTPWDAVICLSTRATGTATPYLPAARVEAIWAIADPSTLRAQAADLAVAYAETWRILFNRIDSMLALPWGQLTDRELTTRLNAIGGMTSAEVDPALAA